LEKIKVGVVGIGTIGKRVADAVTLQPDMELAGIAARSYNWRVQIAHDKGYPIYSQDDGASLRANGIPVQGTMLDLIKKVNIIVDCSPGKIGAENKEKYYVPNKVKAIFEGGEKAKVAEVSFTAQCNYDEAIGKNYVRVVSCNTTGLARTINEVDKLFGVHTVYATMIRRAADPWDISAGPINGIEPVLELPSHHGPDVKTVLHHIETFTNALSVSTTLMHVHTVTIDCKKTPNKEEMIKAWEKATRIRIIEGRMGITSTPEIMEYARDLGRGTRGDMPEICIWREAVGTQNNKLLYIQAIHQEADVICENIDCIRAMMGFKDGKKSIEITNKTLGIK
jgi:glyceraldehyde-3-phosphate dehydrogenase (NAD(P))